MRPKQSRLSIFSCHCALLSLTKSSGCAFVFASEVSRSREPKAWREAISQLKRRDCFVTPLRLNRRGKQTPFGLSPKTKRKAKGETASSLHFVSFLAVTKRAVIAHSFPFSCHCALLSFFLSLRGSAFVFCDRSNLVFRRGGQTPLAKTTWGDMPTRERKSRKKTP